MTKQTPMRISLFGHFGSMNSGNEATLFAVASRLRVVFPDSALYCICTNTQNVTAALGIEAVPHTLRSARIWDRQLRLGKRLRTAFLGLSEELREYIRASKVLKGTDVFIVPGTGLLTDAWGLSGWGPYGLAKWTLMARLRGCRVMFVSVGAGPIDSTTGRRLARFALSLAHYRSYRDLPSKKVVEAIGVRTTRDRIYPDLVFGFSEASIPPSPDPESARPVVGLGLMEYTKKYSAAGPTHNTYQRYLESLAAFVRWLLDHEYDVKLLLGDNDTVVIEEFRAVLQACLGSYDEGRVTDRPIGSVQELLSQLSATDAVVATRFHNVLMSLLLEKPVIAISFHHKCSSLMSEMQLAEYCHDINQVDADTLIVQFQALVRNAEDVKRTIVARIDDTRRALDEQYDLLFEDSIDQSRPIPAPTVAT